MKKKNTYWMLVEFPKFVMSSKAISLLERKCPTNFLRIKWNTKHFILKTIKCKQE